MMLVGGCDYIWWVCVSVGVCVSVCTHTHTHTRQFLTQPVFRERPPCHFFRQKELKSDSDHAILLHDERVGRKLGQIRPSVPTV